MTDESTTSTKRCVILWLSKRLVSYLEDWKLRNFANAARQLGSSVAILSSTFHLRDRLARLLFLYRENAADIFPSKIGHIAREPFGESQLSSRRRRGFRKFKGKAELHIPRPTVTENLDPETFPQQFEFLGKEVTTFLKCLNEFPEFTDEAVNSSILSFESDLKVILSRFIRWKFVNLPSCSIGPPVWKSMRVITDPKQCIWILTTLSRSISVPGCSAIYSWSLARDGWAHWWTHFLACDVHRSWWVSLHSHTNF